MWIYPHARKSCSVLTVTTGAYAERYVREEEWRKAYVSTVGIIAGPNPILREITKETRWCCLSIHKHRRSYAVST